MRKVFPNSMRSIRNREVDRAARPARGCEPVDPGHASIQSQNSRFKPVWSIHLSCGLFAHLSLKNNLAVQVDLFRRTRRPCFFVKPFVPSFGKPNAS